ncbi:MAG TPA: hypothetical protein DEB40_03580 [Elusimicrobia bacterium]|nr:hypothetical protein [Elusimicrobiota bacterium]HBT60807.1 hypothetical protein [Elusimicrobiota bacterium]
MSHKHEKPSAERRQHARLPVVEGMIEPITVQFPNGENSGAASGAAQPAILTNLSAGGMSLLMFLEPPHARRLDMILNIPGFEHVPISGKVVRVHQKGPTYNVGIAFVQISRKHQEQINRMAEDHADCDTRIGLKLPEACVKTCTFHGLCVKSHKMPFWPKK